MIITTAIIIIMMSYYYLLYLYLFFQQKNNKSITHLMSLFFRHCCDKFPFVHVDFSCICSCVYCKGPLSTYWALQATTVQNVMRRRALGLRSFSIFCLMVSVQMSEQLADEALGYGAKEEKREKRRKISIQNSWEP